MTDITTKYCTETSFCFFHRVVHPVMNSACREERFHSCTNRTIRKLFGDIEVCNVSVSKHSGSLVNQFHSEKHIVNKAALNFKAKSNQLVRILLPYKTPRKVLYNVFWNCILFGSMTRGTSLTFGSDDKHRQFYCSQFRVEGLTYCRVWTALTYSAAASHLCNIYNHHHHCID